MNGRIYELFMSKLGVASTPVCVCVCVKTSAKLTLKQCSREMSTTMSIYPIHVYLYIWIHFSHKPVFSTAAASTEHDASKHFV